MPELGSSGSVRGVPSNGRPYRDPPPVWEIRSTSGNGRSSPLTTRSSSYLSPSKPTDALSLPVVTIPVAVAAFAGRIPWLGGRRRRASIRRSGRARAAPVPAVAPGHAREFFPYRRGLLRQFRRGLLRLFERDARAVAVLGLPGGVAAAGRFQFEVKRRHAVAAATRPLTGRAALSEAAVSSD